MESESGLCALALGGAPFPPRTEIMVFLAPTLHEIAAYWDLLSGYSSNKTL